MPFVNVKLLEGRSQDQKERLVKAITDALVDICDAKPDYTMVVVEDVPTDHWARDGKMLSKH
ncbi:TPA: 4-oxalocrotonate tautomerase [Candidatus Latescibacteria bacterium]|nr:4-oxalocrotonate tautomerase [Candidatus Latescibacterota bacterium]